MLSALPQIGLGADAAPDPMITKRIEAHRPSKLAQLPPDFKARVGATHVAGKYHLTDKPFLLEGAQKLLELGTCLGKFWFIPDGAKKDYRFNSQWGHYRTLTELAQSDYFKQVFSMPFATILLEAHTPADNGWKDPRKSERFYGALEKEFYEITKHLYQTYSSRKLTFVLQHWEGDWFLRGRGGEKWDPPPGDWQQLCRQMQKWLRARQAGVSTARDEFGKDAACKVLHAAEVNRVLDIHKGIPTMTDKVLPEVELDMVSYSCYDAMKDGVTLYGALEQIRKHAKTTGAAGKDFVYVGEIGIPENEQPKNLEARWDEFLGAALAFGAPYIVHWELYCNELNPQIRPAPKLPVTNASDVRGFWLVKPDGTLSTSGRYLSQLWKRS
jgi:hypothetical protein